ncbi:MAG: GTPase Era, partial [Alphaproteobacteria bacterium]|nr:GTPase Era [Alphaproteobacteria bacterium]
DTPGFPYNASKVSESVSKITWDASRETDYIIFVIDVSKKKLDTSINILKKISTEKKVVLVMNKIDLIHKPELLKIADFFSKIREFEKIFMISSINGSGTDDFLKYCANIIPDGEWIYPEDEITDSSFEKYTSEITREHIYHRLHHEIPYKCTVETENYQQQSDGSIKIVQNIYVKNNAHKIIFLGHNGEKIKAIGKATRKELSNLLNRNVHLFLNVVVKEK